jgi:hypothetical protein
MLLAGFFATNAGAQLNDTVQTDIQVNANATRSQEQIDAQRDATEDAGVQFARFTLEADSLERYNTQLAEQVRSQEAELTSIETQLAGIETTTREIQPLMQTMVDTLRTFVALDIPFLLDERTTRVQTLVDTLARADVPISEKYRRILEAYQIELEYGRTFDSYEGRLGDGDDTRTVMFVRLGRIALLYRTMDGSEVGYWNRDTSSWVVDPGPHRCTSTSGRKSGAKNPSPRMWSMCRWVSNTSTRARSAGSASPSRRMPLPASSTTAWRGSSVTTSTQAVLPP